MQNTFGQFQGGSCKRGITGVENKGKIQTFLLMIYRIPRDESKIV